MLETKAVGRIVPGSELADENRGIGERHSQQGF